MKFSETKTRKLLLISLFSGLSEQNKHPHLFLLSPSPAAPTTLVFVCAFFYVLYTKALHKACSRNFNRPPPSYLATVM